jgi:hypothetical protein
MWWFFLCAKAPPTKGFSLSPQHYFYNLLLQAIEPQKSPKLMLFDTKPGKFQAHFSTLIALF